MVNEEEIRELVAANGAAVNEGRTIRQLITDGERPCLSGYNVLESKVSYAKEREFFAHRLKLLEALYI